MTRSTTAAVGAADTGEGHPLGMRSTEPQGNALVARRDALLAEMLRRWGTMSPEEAEAYGQDTILKCMQDPGSYEAMVAMLLGGLADRLERLRSRPIATLKAFSDAEFDGMLLGLAGAARLEFVRKKDAAAAQDILEDVGPGFDHLLIQRAIRAFAGAKPDRRVPPEKAAVAAIAPLQPVFAQTRRFDPELQKRVYDSIYLHVLNVYAELPAPHADIDAAEASSASAACAKGGEHGGEEADEVIRGVGEPVEVAEAGSGHVGDGDEKPAKGDTELSEKRKHSVKEWKERQRGDSKPSTTAWLFNTAHVHETEFHRWQRGELGKGTKVDQRIREVLGRDGRIPPVSPVDS